MDQHISSELPPVKMPEQQTEAAHNIFEVPAAAEHTEAQAAAMIERGQSVPSDPAQHAPVAPQLGQLTAVQASPAHTVTPMSSSPAIADDADLIEKEWVIKAKEIVARTRHDPYQQNKDVEHLKADYLKKRYNKDVKVTEN